jgi:general secretion pathway protein K
MRGAQRQGGFALLVVLWTLGFLSLLGTALVAVGRQEAQRARNLLDAAAVEAKADGAVQQAIYSLLDPSPARWLADGKRRLLRSGHYRTEIRLDDENGKVNPNFAPVEMMQALLVRVGVAGPDAAKLAARIEQWRTPGNQAVRLASTQAVPLSQGGGPFESIDELGQVPGMTHDLLARLKPHLSLFSNYDPDATTSDPVVAAAIGALVHDAPKISVDLSSQVVTVSVVVRNPGGASFSERVVVRTNGFDGIRRHEILWREIGPVAAPPTATPVKDE